MNDRLKEVVESLAFWPIFSGLIALALGLEDRTVAAVLILLSGALALPSLQETLARYDLSEPRRLFASVGAFAAGLAVLVLTPAATSNQVAKEDQVDSAVGIGTDTTVTNMDVGFDANMADISMGTDALHSVTLGGIAGQRLPLAGCYAVDGDTLYCGGEAIRLLGIDAPEMPGHCQTGRVCAPGDPFSSKLNLASSLIPGLTIERIGSDRFGRTLGMVYAGSSSLSCQQIQRGGAIYVADWDDGRRVAAECPGSTTGP